MFNKRKPNLTEGSTEPALSPALREALALTSLEPPVAQPPTTSRSKTVPSSVLSTLQSSEKPSIITEGFEIKGELHSSGVLHVEGRVSGLLTAHTVHISAGGQVDGQLICTSLTVKGSFSGSAQCEDLVIANTARLDGEISYRFITIGAGAIVKSELKHLV